MSFVLGKPVNPFAERVISDGTVSNILGSTKNRKNRFDRVDCFGGELYLDINYDYCETFSTIVLYGLEIESANLGILVCYPEATAFWKYVCNHPLFSVVMSAVFSRVQGCSEGISFHHF